MEKIKIGRTEIPIIKGDYILFNGSIYQFVAHDGRSLRYKGHNRIPSLVIPKTTLDKIPLTKLQKREGISFGMKVTYWFF